MYRIKWCKNKRIRKNIAKCIAFLSEYIKEGITLGGVTGTLKDLDTSDATATAEDILEGKVAYARGKIIAPIERTKGNDRFYVMKLDDFNSGTKYCWYDDADGKLDNGEGPAENDFGKGRENTATMIAEWNKGENGKYGQQNTGAYDDIWVANNSLGSITASVVYNSYFVRLATTF